MGNVTGWRSADNTIPSRPATEVDFLIIVQVTDFADCVPSGGTIAEKSTKR
ncbi:hypothetical protein [Agriterribacter sp.]|uniref:hypothetical protein n=1 Tax=Agriterribacter sp. TaxID=2821509 RepID=UPI002CA8902E|nr:hypothetical protein [Agriterribacter sp.]HRO48467.1 hypothetical protein [Agriterribacter sp.]